MLTTAGSLAIAALAAWLLGVGVVLAVCRNTLSRLWAEPVLCRPVLVLESDDWGAGPVAQADRLRDIAAVLCRHIDAAHRPAMFSLALVLAVPDGPAIEGDGHYRRVELDDLRLAPVLGALRAGAARGVFALQLHGFEHYWPPALMASGDPAVQDWLRGPLPAATEALPAQLQSRWVDASMLPSRPLPSAAIRTAVAGEVAAYARVFGCVPAVVVPPTFVWTTEVERAWAEHGVRFIVTPGWRSTCRNAAATPDGDEGPIVNGCRAGELTYLVRTDYFEPVRGRGAAYALAALDKAAAQGRPCILENHRDNFIFDPAGRRRSLDELDALLAGALRRFPTLRFLATVDLGRILGERDPQWIVRPWRERLPFFRERLRHSGRPWKLMRLTGLAVPVALLLRLLGRPPSSRVAGAGS